MNLQNSLRISKIETVLKSFTNSPKENYRKNQILEAVFKKKVKEWQQISALPQEIRNTLEKQLGKTTLSLKPSQIQKSRQATKILFELQDQEKIEAVHMTFKNGHRSLCISSQVGCALQCSFCATGAVGFKRQLTPDEITDQVLYFQQNQMETDSISFMGMGEPFMNPRVFDALDILTDPLLFGIPQRKISISTVGIIPAIQKLTKSYPDVNLAFSLHSPFNNQRDILVPQNKVYPLAEVMKVLDEHLVQTKRKIFIAYLLLDAENDTLQHAKAIADLIHSTPHPELSYLFHVNLLRYNPAFGIGENYKETKKENLERFSAMLQNLKISVSTRQSFGVDIDAACGQLFAKYPKKAKAIKKSSPPSSS